jgi:GNAT superfamily N-acetyltransferase
MGLRLLGAGRLYRRLMLLDRPLGQPIPDLPLPPGVSVRMLGVDDIPAYLAFRPGQDPVEIRRRILEGQWGFVAWQDGEIMTVSWTSPGHAPIEYLAWDLPLAPDEAYSYDLYTSPAFRGRRLASAIRIPALRYAREQGCRRLLAALLPENVAGWKTPSAIGFRHIGWIGYVGFGPLRRRFCTLASVAVPLASVPVKLG